MIRLETELVAVYNIGRCLANFCRFLSQLLQKLSLLKHDEMLHIDVAGRLFRRVSLYYLFPVGRLLVVPGDHLGLLNCKWRLSQRSNHGGWLGPLSTYITLEVLEKGLEL